MLFRSDVYAREVAHIVNEFVPEALKGYIEARLEDAEETMVDGLAHAIHRTMTT